MDFSIFLLLFNKVIPLYAIIVMGFIATKVLKVPNEAISRLLIYILAPIVFFTGAYTVEFSRELLLLPLFFLGISTGISLAFYQIGKIIWKEDPTKNILAFGAGTGNTGYFGFPLILTLLGDAAFSKGVFILIGMTIFEVTVGYYITARGNYSIKESFIKLFKLPLLYAFVLGITCNILEVNIGGEVMKTLLYVRGAYTVLGMMIIGMGFALVTFQSVDKWFLFLTLGARMIIWPLLISIVVFLDNNYFQLFDTTIHEVMYILAIVPLAANLVVFSTELKVHPDKAALAVMISTILALFYIPLFLSKVVEF